MANNAKTQAASVQGTQGHAAGEEGVDRPGSVEEKLSAGEEVSPEEIEAAEAAATEKAEAEAAEAEAAEKAELEENPDTLKDGEIEGLKPGGQAKVNKRIGKITARAKTAEERAVAAEEKATAAEAKAAAAEERLDDSTRHEAFQLGIHSDYIDKAGVELLKQDKQLGEDEAWLLEHFDGYVGTGTEEQPEHTKAQIRQRYGIIREKRQDVGARAALLRAECSRKMTEDMKKGRGKTETRPTSPVVGKAKAPAPPSVPAGGSATGKPPLSAGKEKARFDTKRIMKDGVTPESMEKEFEKIL